MSDTVIPHMSAEEFRRLGYRVVDWIAGYLERVESLPVLSQVAPGQVLAQIPEQPPVVGLGHSGATPDAWQAVFADLERVILPGMTHWQSPNFFAFFPCNASGPGILGEMLSAAFNVNGMMWATSPAATELEMRVLDWMAQLLGLPAAFRLGGPGGGCIQGTASESTLISMLAARARVLRQQPADTRPHLTAYASTQAHSSVVKAAMIAGLARHPDDRTHLRLVGTDDGLAMRPDLLESAIRDDLSRGYVPFWVCATVGTTGTTAIDPLDAIGQVLRRTGLHDPTQRRAWLHVDAAHAATACICPEYRHLLAGVEHADSLCFNAHKWLLTNFDCDCFWTADRTALHAALAVTPEYLRHPASERGQVTDFRDWQIPLGRRFRALKLWLVIRHYGVEGLRAYVREHLRLAALFEDLVRRDARFELAAPRTVNLVCFRLRHGDDELNRQLLDRLNASGRVYLTHTVIPAPGGGTRFVLRMSIGATLTREAHVRAAWDLICTCANELLRR